MKVILLQDVPKIGRKFDVKDVADGYGHNFLLRNKLAEMATASVVKKYEDMRKKMEEEKKSKEAELIKKLASIGELSLESKANEEGNLFAGIKKEEILKLFKDSGVELNENELIMDKPIKTSGEHEISVKVDSKVTKVKISIKAVKE